MSDLTAKADINIRRNNDILAAREPEETTTPATPGMRFGFPHPWEEVDGEVFTIWSASISYAVGSLVWGDGNYWRATTQTTMGVLPSATEWEVYPTSYYDHETQYLIDNTVIYNLNVWKCVEEGSLGIYPTMVIMDNLNVIDGIGAWFIETDFVIS